MRTSVKGRRILGMEDSNSITEITEATRRNLWVLNKENQQLDNLSTHLRSFN